MRVYKRFTNVMAVCPFGRPFPMVAQSVLLITFTLTLVTPGGIKPLDDVLLV